MAYVTAYPFRFSSVGSHFFLLEFPQGRASWLDVWLNVLFFAPFGILCGLRVPGMNGLVVCGLTSLIFSSGIEWMQMYIPGRCASMTDIAMNTLGGTIGAFVANRKILRAASLEEWLKREVPGNRVGILIGLWVIANWSPFIPLLKIYAFTNQLKAAFRFDLSWTKLLEILLGSFAVVFLLRENLTPSRARIASWILIGLLPIQLANSSRFVFLIEARM